MIPALPLDRSRGPGQHALRVPFDFYATPPEATSSLLTVEQFDGPIWEPACGDGGISIPLTHAGHQVVSTDLIYRGFGIGGIDFMLEKVPRAKHIITNPPYGRGLADKFIGKALTLTRATGGKVAMLCDLSSLCNPARHKKFTASPPSAIYFLDELVCLPNGDPERAPFMARADRRYCWMVWKPCHEGRPRCWWLSASTYRATA